MIAMERGGVPNSCFHVIKNFWAIHAFFKIFFFFKENYSVKFSTDNDRPKLNNRVIQTNPREGLCFFNSSFPPSSNTFFSLSGAKLYRIRNFLMNFHSR